MTQDKSPADYDDLVRRIRQAVRESVPAGSILLVVSRGDDALLEHDHVTAWHFPGEPDGRYAGFHPRDSAAALAHLDEWRSRGARYLLLPASTSWWLDYYEDFREDLRRRGTVLEIDACTIACIGEHGLSRDSLLAADHVLDHVAELVDTLLPRGANVAVVSSGDERFVRLHGRRAAHFPADAAGPRPDGEQPEPEEALAALDAMQESGVEYLVVPSMSPSWLDDHPDFLVEVGRRFPCVVRREGVCSVFEVKDR